MTALKYYVPAQTVSNKVIHQRVRLVKDLPNLTFTCSSSSIGTLEKSVKNV